MISVRILNEQIFISICAVYFSALANIALVV